MSLFFKKKNDNTELKTVSPQGVGLSYEVANLQGMGSRKYQEDSFCVANVFDEAKLKEQGLLFAVCDGMGGLSNGRDASQTAVDIIRRNFFEMDRTKNISESLCQSLTEASEAIFNKYNESGGSTGIAGVIYKDKLHFASVGDSYIFLLRKGILVRLNEQHNLCNRIYEECIREDNWNPFLARNNVEKNALTSYLGIKDISKIDSTVRPIDLLPGDLLLICSDGVNTFIEDDELKALLVAADAGASTGNIENKIIEINNPNQDNYTAIVICVR